MAALTDSEILTQYKLARDALVVAIEDGANVVEYQIGSRRKRVSDPIAELKLVESMITRYQSRIDGAAGRARNFAKLYRR